MTETETHVSLRRINAGMYKTEDGLIRVSRHEGRTWSARLGSHAYTTWTAVLVARVGQGDPETYEVARASTLAALRPRLAKYLEDAAGGTLGPRSRYGFSGDARPVARLPHPWVRVALGEPEGE